MNAQLTVYAALATALALIGCGSGNQAGRMTSYSAAQSPQNQAELFTLPADQLSHVQIYTTVQTPLSRTLRLTGAVAYNSFLTTPVITQVGGPVSRIVVTPGQHVSAGQPLLYVASPDYSLLRSAYIKARDAFQLADKFYKRAQDLYAHGAAAQADVADTGTGRSRLERAGDPDTRDLESGDSRDERTLAGGCAARPRRRGSRRTALLSRAAATARR
jgi:cobalt-zinc-cadmium efflux system membrane fusion protein